jgi:hypothetical protein
MWPPNAAVPLIGMGGMRLSTDRDRDEARAIGVTFFPIYVAALIWGGLFLREERLRALVPLRT